MKHIITPAIAVILAAVISLSYAQTEPQPPTEQSIVTITPEGQEAVEGSQFLIGWQATPDVASLNAVYRAYRTPVGKRGRGTQWGKIAQSMPASAGSTLWRVPWIDSLRFRVYLKGYNQAGQLVVSSNVPLRFRPKELAGQTRNAVYVDLSNRSRQRLYHQRNGELVQVSICSGSSTNYRKRSGGCGGRIHDHLGWFRISQKDPDHVSTFNPEWRMPYAMRFYRAHFIHVTSRRMYRYLGHPASHGCIRLHRVDGRRLYYECRVGDSVCIY